MVDNSSNTTITTILNQAITMPWQRLKALAINQRLLFNKDVVNSITQTLLEDWASVCR